MRSLTAGVGQTAFETLVAVASHVGGTHVLLEHNRLAEYVLFYTFFAPPAVYFLS